MKPVTRLGLGTSMRPSLDAGLQTLAATGTGPRLLFTAAAAVAIAAFVWPVPLDPAPPPAAAIAVPPRPGETALLRPLFDPGRRDWTARGSRGAVLEGEPHRPVLTVRGILIDGTAARALIDDGTPEQTWLTPGEGRGGWRVTAITADGVSVDQGGRPFTAEFMGLPATLRPLPLDPALRR
ncbi:hypothetical protein C0214_07465 [Methylobacterium sp. DM1]|nr:hypothetical protein C0214_07465 [Methylobacterium sp. DM1]